MNYTEKYHLPQWEETDRVMRTDFNQMCAGIENGLKSNAQAAAQAQAAADQAQNTAEQLPYVVGRYRGNDTTQTIELGFRPSFVIISGMIGGGGSGFIYNSYLYGCQTVGTNVAGSIKFIDTGFILSPEETNGYFPQLNLSDRTYEYIAFK